MQPEAGETSHPLADSVESLGALREKLDAFLKTLPADGAQAEALAEFEREHGLFAEEAYRFEASVQQATTQRQKAGDTTKALNKLVEQFAPLAEASRDLVLKQAIVAVV